MLLLGTYRYKDRSPRWVSKDVGSTLNFRPNFCVTTCKLLHPGHFLDLRRTLDEGRERKTGWSLHAHTTSSQSLGCRKDTSSEIRGLNCYAVRASPTLPTTTTHENPAMVARPWLWDGEA